MFALFLCIVSPTLAQRDQLVNARTSPPSGKEIALRAQAAQFATANSTVAMMKGKRIVITPVLVDRKATEQEQLIARMSTEFAGDETNLPPGSYNLFLANVGGKLHCYAESNGRIVAEAARVRIVNTPGSAKPTFVPQGWGIHIECKKGVDSKRHCHIEIDW
jgi:hypothetical protein